jgi:hypothetical protein
MNMKSIVIDIFFLVLTLLTINSVVTAQTCAQKHILKERSYSAPLNRCEDCGPKWLDPGAYEVLLKLGHTLVQHNAETGYRIKAHIVYKVPRYPKVFYIARDVDQNLLRAIRSDIGVQMVGELSKMHLVENIPSDMYSQLKRMLIFTFERFRRLF